MVYIYIASHLNMKKTDWRLRLFVWTFHGVHSLLNACDLSSSPVLRGSSSCRVARKNCNWPWRKPTKMLVRREFHGSKFGSFDAKWFQSFWLSIVTTVFLNLLKRMFDIVSMRLFYVLLFPLVNPEFGESIENKWTPFGSSPPDQITRMNIPLYYAASPAVFHWR